MADLLSSTAEVVKCLGSLRVARAYSTEDACDGEGCVIGETCQDAMPPEQFFQQLAVAETALVEALTILTAEVNIQYAPLER